MAVLGSGVKAVDRTEPWEQPPACCPSRGAGALARPALPVALENGDLADLAAHFLDRGTGRAAPGAEGDLLGCDWSPGRYIASSPGFRVGSRTGNDRYPLIVTTNYDTALERAFEEVHEPFDLAVFMAAGEHKGSFLHLPWWDGPLSGAGSRSPRPDQGAQRVRRLPDRR